MSLMRAIRSGNVHRVQELLESGADPSLAEDGDLPLVIAIDEHQPKIFATLLEHKADAEGVDSQGYTPLIAAVGAEEPEMVLALLAAGAKNFAAVPKEFPPFTALMWACYNGQLEIVRMLLESGADTGQENQQGQSPLILALDHPAIVALLLQSGADPNQNTSSGLLALPSAASKPRGRSIRPLLEAGADPNKADGNGLKPLVAAVQRKLAPAVRWLLTAGADPDVAFHDYSTFDPAISKGATPLLYAAKTGRRRIVESLLQAKANLDIKDDRGQTAYDAALDAGHGNIVQLLEAAAGPELAARQKTREQYTAMLLQAAKRGILSQVQEALQNHADTEVMDQGFDFGMTPLMHACKLGRDDLVDALLAGGADIQRIEPKHLLAGQGFTALHYAAQSGHASCVQKLLEAGADTEVFDEVGFTPLMWASQEGHLACVEALLASDANPLTVSQSEDDFEEDDETSDQFEEEIDEFEEDDEFEDDDESEDYDDVAAQTAMGLAIAAGHFPVVQALLAASDQPVPAALVEAARNLQPEVLRLLLDNNYSVHETDRAGSGPLHALGGFSATITLPRTKTSIMDRPKSQWQQVVKRRQLGIAQMLLDAGASVTQTDNRGRTPLMVATCAHTSLTRQTIPYEGAEMHDLAESDPIGYVRVLLDAGADPKAKDHQGNTALHYAFRRGFMEESAPRVVSNLIKAGAELDARNLRGQTPLMLAVKSDDVPGVKKLLQRGASARLCDRRGQTVLHYAIDAHRPEPIMRLLLDGGADSAVADQQGRTPLDYAREHHCDEAVKLLRKTQATETRQKEWQLAEAIEKNELAEVCRLLDAGADLHYEVHGQNAFVHAVLLNCTAAVEELVHRGADVRQTHREFRFGRNSQALHSAAQVKNPQLLEKLLQLGADPCATNDRDWSPVTVAACAGQQDNVNLLLQAGGSLDTLAEDFLESLNFGEKTDSSDYLSAVQHVTSKLGAEPQPLNWAKGLVHWPVDASAETRKKLQQDPKLNEWVASWQAQSEKRERLLSELQPPVRELGSLLVGVQSGRGCSPSSDFLALFPTTNQFALIAAMGVYGNDAELSCAELIGLLRKLHQQEPYDLQNMKNDALDIVFRSLVQDPKKIAKQLYKTCPDIVDQGVSMKKLVESLESSPKIHFWWD